MTFREGLDATVRFFQAPFRGGDGRFRPSADARAEAATALRGELAFADPCRLFPGKQPWLTYNPSQLVGAKGYEIFREMRRDDQVKAALAFKKHACIATGWQVTSPEGKPKDWEVTEFLKWVLMHLDPMEIGSPTLDADLYEILGALDFGFSWTEKIYAPIESGPWEGHIGLKALKTRAPWGVQFAQDAFGNLMDNGVVQQGNTVVPGGRLPRNKMVLFSYQSEFGNPYGTSDLESAYYPFWCKQNAQKWLAMLLERMGIPPIMGLYNPARYAGGQAVTDLKTILMNLQASTVGVIPRPDKEALEFWAPELAGNATRVFLPSLEYFNKGIARSILMPDLLGMTSDTSQGSYARAQIHFDVFLLVVEAIRKDLEVIVMQHQVVKPLLDLNFPNLEEYPTWSFMPLTDDLRMELLTKWHDLVKDGVVTNGAEDEIHIRKLMKFPEKEDPEADPPSAKIIDAQTAAKLAPPNGTNGGGPGGATRPKPFLRPVHSSNN